MYVFFLSSIRLIDGHVATKLILYSSKYFSIVYAIIYFHHFTVPSQMSDGHKTTCTRVTVYTRKPQQALWSNPRFCNSKVD